MSVVVEAAEPNGLAAMLAGVVRANLERIPDRRRLLGDAVYELVALDAGVSATISVAGGAVRIVDGPPRAAADVVVRAAAGDLLDLAAAPLRFGLPDALSAAGRSVLRRVAGRRIRIEGLARHPVLVSRLARLLSVA